MDIVNETPSIVNIQRFPQREEENKKAKKKYPQQKSLMDAITEVPKEVEEENNVIDITNYQDNPVKTDTPDLTGVQKRKNEFESKRIYEG